MTEKQSRNNKKIALTDICRKLAKFIRTLAHVHVFNHCEAKKFFGLGMALKYQNFHLVDNSSPAERLCTKSGCIGVHDLNLNARTCTICNYVSRNPFLLKRVRLGQGADIWSLFGQKCFPCNFRTKFCN